ncbi:MAG: phosphoribosyltransferase [Candidatus Bathyarchaeota archaeon]|nr:phosphoribosyltransferase [Candidatus Bathyarchaeota archaeon]
MKVFADRTEAGKQLACALKPVDKDALVLAVPRGGVVVGYEISYALKIQLDVLITKKIGAPGNPELAIGAVAEDGTYLLDDSVVHMFSAPQSYIRAEAERQKNEIERRLRTYRQGASSPEIAGRDVILVDDGVATGATLRAALRSLQNRGTKTVTIAVPVGPSDTIRMFRREADRVVCLSTPEPFYAIGQFYEDFDQTTDEEVIELLKRNKQELQDNEGKP